MNEEILQSYLDADPNIQNKYTFDEFASMQPQANNIPALEIQPNFSGGISNLAQGFAQRFSPRQTFMPELCRYQRDLWLVIMQYLHLVLLVQLTLL